MRDPCSDPNPRQVSWTVRVTNRGNIASPLFPNNFMPWCDAQLLQTGIVPEYGRGNWESPLDGLRFTGLPSIQPESASSGLRQFDFAVTGYRILCGAFLGTQYIKAEFFCDQCNGASNWNQKAIEITLP